MPWIIYTCTYSRNNSPFISRPPFLFHIKFETIVNCIVRFRYRNYFLGPVMLPQGRTFLSLSLKFSFSSFHVHILFSVFFFLFFCFGLVCVYVFLSVFENEKKKKGKVVKKCLFKIPWGVKKSLYLYHIHLLSFFFLFVLRIFFSHTSYMCIVQKSTSNSKRFYIAKVSTDRQNENK